MDHIEIERKFLYNGGTPPAELLESTVSIDLVTQFYLVSEQDQEVRMHREVNQDGVVSCYKTTKTGNGLQRTELIEKVDEDVFGMALYESNCTPIHKCRISALDVPTGLEVEIDTFLGTLFGLSVIEVEFKSVEDSQNFKVPMWFGADVTEDISYKNKNLWRKINNKETLG